MSIKNVFVCGNGMVVVFNNKGKQIPKLQGPLPEVFKKIGKAVDEDTEIHFAEAIDMSWWFREKGEGR